MSEKIVFTDTTAADYEIERELLGQSGLELTPVFLQTRDSADVAREAADADAVVMSWAKMTRAVMESLERCIVISRYGIGVDMIDLVAATEHGILVCNTARYCIDEVSTQAIAFLLMLNRRIVPQVSRLRSGGWSARELPAPRRLAGQRLGLVGFGNIGRAMATKARGLGLDVAAFDPYLQRTRVEIDDVSLVSLDELLRTSDYVSIHCPLNASTRHLIGEHELSLMKSSAFLINCARGAIIDQTALTAALAKNRIAGAGLDVVDPEPPPPDDPLRHLDNVLLTPHTAHWSIESAIESRRTAVENVLAALRGRIPADVVNREVLEQGARVSIRFQHQISPES